MYEYPATPDDMYNTNIPIENHGMFLKRSVHKLSPSATCSSTWLGNGTGAVDTLALCLLNITLDIFVFDLVIVFNDWRLRCDINQCLLLPTNWLLSFAIGWGG